MPINGFLTYLEYELGFSSHTVTSYATDLSQWRDYSTGGNATETFDPRSVTVSDLRLWVAHLSRQGLSQRSIKRKVSAVRSFYKYMMKRHGYESNPAADIAVGRMPKSLPVFIPGNEINNLIDEKYNEDDFTTVRNHLIINTLYSTGIRASELTSLTVSRIDTRRGELKVLGKRNKERIIPFGAELTREIDSYLALRKAICAKQGIIDCTAALFVTPDLRPLTYHKVWEIVHKWLDGRVHASRTSPHVLRHSFATDMLNGGAGINAVQQLLGHQSLATTQIYTHISISELKSNYELAHPRALKKGGIHGS